jgi:hypothetical protein
VAAHAIYFKHIFSFGERQGERSVAKAIFLMLIRVVTSTVFMGHLLSRTQPKKRLC